MNAIVVLAALILSGMALMVLTSEKLVVQAPEASRSEEALLPAKIFVTTSEPTQLCELMLGEQKLSLNKSGETEWISETELDPNNAVIFLKALRTEKGDGRFFAKLVIEIAGKETLTHYFDSAGEIDDFLELTF
jgi:hypothetical protein